MISTRSSWVGNGTTIWRSKRPGRSSAGSRTSGRFVAAIITMPSVASKRSISASIWSKRLLAFVVSTAEAGPALATDGVDLVDEERSRAACLPRRVEQVATRAAPTPTNISMKSEPVTDTNGTPASPATARAMRVLPDAGGPTSSTPLGMRAPICLNFAGSSGSRRPRDLRPSPGRSRRRHRRSSSASRRVHLRPAPADAHESRGLGAGAAAHRHEHTDDEQQREQQREQLQEEVRAGPLVLELDVVVG